MIDITTATDRQLSTLYHALTLFITQHKTYYLAYKRETDEILRDIEIETNSRIQIS